MITMLRRGLILLAVLTALPLQGCADHKEINELALVDMVGVDEREDGTKLAYYQIVNPNGVASSKTGGSRSPIYTFAFKGKSWAEFSSNASSTIPRKLFISHFQAYIVSERLAKKGLGELLNFLESDPTRRMATSVFIAKGSVRDIMDTYVPLARSPGNELRSIHELQAKLTGRADRDSQVKTLVENYEDGSLAFVSNISLSGGEPFDTTKRYETIEGNRGNFTLSGASIIRQGRWIGELKPEQLSTLLLVLGKERALIEDIVLSKGASAQLEMLVRPRIERRLSLKDGKPALRVIVKPKLKLMSINAAGKIDSVMLRRLERLFNQRLEGRIGALLAEAKAKQWDLLGIGRQIGRRSGSRWAAAKRDPNAWREAEVSVSVRSSIVKTGVLLTPYAGGSAP
ncbi:Ger(x)C family spore germination protein [Paenibacillus sacheonensis]|uniref:Ger(X)C family spore germination protein n=1 Tax=Paenibacillus sacheonensis TaxID=742054 RepID=A0A7X4YX99_9BACL|nr:Ger(x)C family spore germination protein [Paenibacillus sacheonensis]MBM7566595.1 spore germination protein KC [Paenibacillus sacheonensis]NBC73094.1 Ger(x)C family spore germination protein [Paenibacillus sacheonensis]